MTLHLYTRKLLLPLKEEDHDPTTVASLSKHTFAHSPSQTQEGESPANYYSNVKLNPPFDSAMALTVLVLLTALFFMGFFSIYIRRFADESNVDPTRRRRSSTANPESATSSTTSSYLSRLRESAKGVDPKVVESLPVYAYFPGEVKQGMIDDVECAICLSEFVEKEWMKEIPYCGHMFHVDCIDTWLSSHVTCPLCRTSKLLAEEKAVVVEVEGHVDGGTESFGLGGGEVEGVRDGGGAGEVRLVVVSGDTWNEEEREAGPTSEGRSNSSCVGFGEIVRLHRSMSF